jgi:NADP-dependent 3-hydroxy acid dehydrogenase YdfG
LAAKAFDAKSQGTNNFYNFLKLKKMGIQKMSLANIQGKLSRTEMKNIMAGSGSGCTVKCVSCTTDADCAYGSNLYCESSNACTQYSKVCRRAVMC